MRKPDFTVRFNVSACNAQQPYGETKLMDTVFHRLRLDVLHAKSVKEFSQRIEAFVHFVGLATVGATVITEHSTGLTEFQSVTNLPAAYLADFRDLNAAKLDPVSQHCKHSSRPVIWDQAFYVSNGRGDFWEKQASFGLQCGVSLAFHLPRGRHFLFGVDGSQRTCGDARKAKELAMDVHEFASYAQAAAFDLCIPYARGSDQTKLAKGELDALRWSIDGLSNWEVGKQMGISETEVLLRLRRAMFKLGCANKYETALRAIRLGLVACE